MPSFERRPAGGALPSRVEPDANDALVWYDFDPTYSTWANSGAGGTLPLSVVGNGARVLGQYGDAGWTPYPLDSNAAGGMLASAGTAVGESQTLTASAWVWLERLPSGPVLDLLLGKQAGTGAWSSPFYDWGLFATELGQLLAVCRYSGGQTLAYSPEDTLTAPGLYHVGLTLDLTRTVRGYCNSAKVAEITMPGGAAGIDYSGGRYLVGGMPVDGASAPRYSMGAAGDIRIATVTRNQSWFQSVAATRRIP